MRRQGENHLQQVRWTREDMVLYLQRNRDGFAEIVMIVDRIGQAALAVWPSKNATPTTSRFK